jgi:hypothetical protein
MKYGKARNYAFLKMKKDRYGPDTSADLAALKFDLKPKQRIRLTEECRRYHSRQQ